MNSILIKIKSSYCLKEIFSFVGEKTKLQLLKYNKFFQKKIDLSIKDYNEFLIKKLNLNLKEYVIKIKFDIEFVNHLRNEYKDLKKKFDNENYENEEQKKKLNLLEFELKKTRFMGLPFFNYYREFIKIFYIREQNKNEETENSVFYNFLDETKPIPEIKICIDKNGNITDCFSMFANCETIKEIEFEHFDTKDVTSMRHMFYFCSHLRHLDLSNFDTSNVTDMFGLCKKCYSLETFKISEKFNTSKVENMEYLFEDCKNLLEVDLHYLDTSNIKDFSYMFNQCKKLQKVDISSFNAKNVCEFHAMFQGCESLTYVDLSSFKTDNLKSITYMFCDCKKLYKIDLSNFNFNKLEEVENSFTNCPAKIKLKKNSKLANFIPENKIIYID